MINFEFKSVTLAIIGGTIDMKILISLAPATKVQVHIKANGLQHNKIKANCTPQNLAKPVI